MKKNIVLTGLLAAMMFFTTAYILHIPIVGGGYVHLGDAVLYMAASRGANRLRRHNKRSFFAVKASTITALIITVAGAHMAAPVSTSAKPPPMTPTAIA